MWRVANGLDNADLEEIEKLSKIVATAPSLRRFTITTWVATKQNSNHSFVDEIEMSFDKKSFLYFDFSFKTVH